MAEAQHPVIRSDGTSPPRTTALAILKLQQQITDLLKRIKALEDAAP
jgi:hypothetical protein